MASCWPGGADITNTYHDENGLLHHLGLRRAQETSCITEETWLTQSCDLFKGPVLEGTCISTCVLFSLFKPHYCNESTSACLFLIVSVCPFYLLQSKLGRFRRTACRALSSCQSSRSEWSHRVFPHYKRGRVSKRCQRCMTLCFKHRTGTICRMMLCSFLTFYFV